MINIDERWIIGRTDWLATTRCRKLFFEKPQAAVCTLAALSKIQSEVTGLHGSELQENISPIPNRTA